MNSTLTLTTEAWSPPDCPRCLGGRVLVTAAGSARFHCQTCDYQVIPAWDAIPAGVEPTHTEDENGFVVPFDRAARFREILDYCVPSAGRNGNGPFVH